MKRLSVVVLVFVLLFFVAPALTTVGESASSGVPVTGQVLGISVERVTAQTATCASPYTIQSGDTLTGIALRCGITYAVLLAANPGYAANPNLIFPGQTLVIPPGVPVTGSGTYTVRAGDRLYRIALANGTTVAAILAANPWITNPNLIYPGWVITIPGGIPNTGGGTYTVVSGDTLFSIATRYNTTVAALAAANPWITNVNLIYPGWVITIP